MRVVFHLKCPGTFPLAQVQKFQDDDILYVFDVYDDQRLDELLGHRGNPVALINDSFTFLEHQRSFPVYCVNLWLEKELTRFRQLPMITEPSTEYVANFIINKKQINRYLAMKLVEYFKISVDYTWSGIGNFFNMSDVIDSWQTIPLDQIPQDARNCLLAPVGLPPKWIDYQSNQGNDSSVINYGGNVWTWNNGIKDIVSKSAVSIITESIWTQSAMHFSEKTLYSVLGLTFPLWVGGYRQADEWRKCGFDTFDDVINHDYQYYPTVIERCWWAVALNADLLQNLGAVRNLRKQHLARLIANRDLVLSDQLRNHNDTVIAAWPEDIQKSMVPILTLFR